MNDAPTLTLDTWNEIEDAIGRFEEAWRSNSRPEIRAFLHTGDGRLRLLNELVHIDLENRLRYGEPARVEEYLTSYPELANDRSTMLELIVAEYKFRRRREPGLNLAEFLDRFPEYRDEVRERIANSALDDATVSGLPADPRSAAPPEVAGYEILGLLGRGGMGVVYRARQVGLNRTVALKMVSTGVHAGPDEIARLRAEAAVLARMQHPNIVQIYDVGEAAGQPYFAFEFVRGGSLAQYLCGMPQPVVPAARLIETIARAVHAAHVIGVIHRDLKPANILLCDEQDHTSGKLREPLRLQSRLGSVIPKIADFGLAKCAFGGGDDVNLRGPTLTGDIVGTPSYMAPEQAMISRQPIGPGADVYAIGAMLYELLTGRPPFTGETPLVTVFQLLNNEPVSVTHLRPNVPRDLETICLKCLHKDPRQRFSSALELAEDLQRFLRDEPIHARPTRTREKVWRWVRRRPTSAGLLGAGLIAPVVALIALSLLSGPLVRSNALESAAQQAELLEHATKEYSRNVQRVERSGYTVNKTVPPTTGTVPLSIPATFLHDVGRELGAAGRTGVRVRQYSDFPFPWRTESGPRDEFERYALRHLRQTKGRDSVHEFTNSDGRRVLRYAQARVMERSCVECHNTHPQSPRKNWQVGDVRGVLEIIRPLDKEEARVGEALRLALLLSAMVSGSLLGASMFVVVASRRRTHVGS